MSTARSLVYMLPVRWIHSYQISKVRVVERLNRIGQILSILINWIRGKHEKHEECHLLCYILTENICLHVSSSSRFTLRNCFSQWNCQSWSVSSIKYGLLLSMENNCSGVAVCSTGFKMSDGIDSVLSIAAHNTNRKISVNSHPNQKHHNFGSLTVDISLKMANVHLIQWWSSGTGFCTRIYFRARWLWQRMV